MTKKKNQQGANSALFPNNKVHVLSVFISDKTYKQLAHLVKALNKKGDGISVSKSGVAREFIIEGLAAIDWEKTQ